MRSCQGRDNGAIPFTRSNFFLRRSSSAGCSSVIRGSLKAPNPKLQAPKKIQSPTSKGSFGTSALRGLDYENGLLGRVWSLALGLLWSLELGAWCLTQSLWCSSANTPASHAGDRRSEAGQGRQFPCPQSILSDGLLWYGSQFGATPGGAPVFGLVVKREQQTPQIENL